MDGFKSALLRQGSKLENTDLKKFHLLLKKYDRHTGRINEALYDRLNEADRARFVEWFLLRWGGISIVSSKELEKYHAAIKKFSTVEKLPTKVGQAEYSKVNFKPQGVDFDLIQYDWVIGIHDIYYNQYEHGPVRIMPGDVIVDAGAFIGDTAILFSHKVDGDCAVHSFELLDENIALINANIELNKTFAKNIKTNKVALSHVNGDTLWIETNAIQGATKASSNNSSGREKILTTTLDHYVEAQKLDRVDFIKMDIEGAEVPALKGSKATIQRFKPKLAVCLYHIWTDPFAIPELINSFGVNYDFGFKWVQMTKGWEAVLLASPQPTTADQRKPIETSSAEMTDALEAFITHSGEAFEKKYDQADALWKQLQKN